jgi:23S rRNA (uracil1939-C5)-methyltransferase
MTALRIEKMLYGGSAAAATGETVPFVLPGELVEIAPANETRILEPSPDRVTPGCIHFGGCGGCHYQHATYPAQLRIKEAILRDTLASAGLADPPKIEVHSGPPWHYRNRIRLRIGEADGAIRFGYNRQASSEANAQPAFLPVTMCPIAAPILWQAASALLELARTRPAVQIWLASTTELELFTNAGETALQLTLFTRNPPAASFPAFCAAVQASVPQLTGAGVAILPKKPSPHGRRFEHARPGPQWGAPGLVYKVGEDSHWVGRGAFFQINRHLVSTLADLATGDRSGSIAWDLYAGVGLFSRALTNSFAQVTGVEAADAAAASLAAALKPPHRAVKMTALDFLEAAVVQRERPGLIVMDPPRAGVGVEVCALLGRIRAPELVYVSCDPVTLARDLRQLTGSGYRIAALHLVDMFPQTFHMETVVILRR